MAAHVPQQKIDDCRELYLRFGGLEHDRLVAEMRAKGWSSFTKRNLYARTRGGLITPGWPERFGWDGEIALQRPARMQKPARKQGRNTQQGLSTSRHRSKPGTAYANRRTFAREHTAFPKAAMLTPEPPKFNRQMMRRLRKRSADTLVRTDAASAFGGVSVISNSDGNEGSPAGGTGGTGEGACAPGSGTSDFHAWLKTLPGVWGWDYRHQLYLYKRLKRVTDGSCKRLMIFMPPRHGKSEMVTVRYAAWRLKQDPSMNIILGSYNQRLADKFSRKIKRVLCDDALSGSAAVMCGKAQPFRQPVKEVMAAQPPAVAGRARRQIDNDYGKAQPFHTALGHSPEEINSSPFPFTKPRPINTVSEWETTMGGGLRAVGVGSGVTGYGASLIMIDDPVKSREQASSERFREKVWDWFNDDIYTRLEPGGAIILIQTRWHEDDLAGRLLKEMADGGEQWEIVSLPALAEEPLTAETRRRREEVKENWPQIDADNTNRSENDLIGPDPRHPCPSVAKSSSLRLSVSAVKIPVDELGRVPGEPLWPDRFPIEELERIRATMNEISFASLYQQRPVPREGGVFKRAWFTQIVDHAPKGLKWKRGYDLAISIKQTADFTASFRVAYDSEGYLYIDGGYRRRIDFPQQRRYIIERMTLERDTEHGIEAAIHGRSVMQELRKLDNLRGRQFRGVEVKGDKQQRALSWIRLAEEGRIRLTRGPWNKPFVEEACAFPHGAHDDQIDAVSLAVSMHERKPSKLFVF